MFDTTKIVIAINNALDTWTCCDWERDFRVGTNDDTPAVFVPSEDEDKNRAELERFRTTAELERFERDGSMDEALAEVSTFAGCCARDAAAANGLGRDALKLIADGCIATASCKIDAARDLEAEYGDDLVWGPVADMFDVLMAGE